jgi:predicted transposase YbfD/YdcC
MEQSRGGRASTTIGRQTSSLHHRGKVVSHHSMSCPKRIRACVCFALVCTLPCCAVLCPLIPSIIHSHSHSRSQAQPRKKREEKSRSSSRGICKEPRRHRRCCCPKAFSFRRSKRKKQNHTTVLSIHRGIGKERGSKRRKW